MSAACAHAKSPKDISAPTSAQLFGACLRIAHPRRQSDTWAERGAAEEAAAREAEAAAREEEAARAAFAQPAGWKYSYESGDDTVNHRYTFALREDGTYSLRSDHTAMLEGICGGDTKKGTWSLDEDGVTIRIDGKVFQFDCGASTITSEKGTVYRRCRY